MSYQVNLILSNEVRSGSKFNVRSMLRVGSITLPVILLFVIAQQALSSFMLNSQLSVLESQWGAMEPKQKQAVRQRARMNHNLQTKKELVQWRQSRLEGTRVLLGLLESVPGDIQITAFHLSATTFRGQQNKPEPMTRKYTLKLDGTISTDDAMSVIERFQQRLETHPAIATQLDDLSVSNFAAPMETTDEQSRVFSILCNFLVLPREEKP